MLPTVGLEVFGLALLTSVLVLIPSNRILKTYKLNIVNRGASKSTTVIITRKKWLGSRKFCQPVFFNLFINTQKCALDTSWYMTLFESANVQREKWNKNKSVIESKLKKQWIISNILFLYNMNALKDLGQWQFQDNEEAGCAGVLFHFFQ